MSKRSKQTRGNPARRGAPPLGASALAREFERWMNESRSTFTDPATARAGLARLLAFGHRAGFDLLDPEDAGDILDALLELGPDGDTLIDLLHDYVHFRLETAREGAWDDAHELLEETLSPDDALPEVVSRALADAELLDPEQRHHALAGVRVVARVRDVLEWIGTGRAVTGSGALRRADIAPVAALLGISARGVAKRPASGEFRGGVPTVGGEALVQSMWELVPLAAWWEALRAADIIQVTATRVRQGPGASGWLATTSPPLDDASAVAVIFIAHLLTEAIQGEADDWGIACVRLTIAEAMLALDPDASTDVTDRRTPIEDLLLPRAQQILGYLADAGLLVAGAAGRFRVPEPLRGTFASGVVLAMSFAAQALGAADGFSEVDDPSPFDDPEIKAEMARHGIVHVPGMAEEMLRELEPLLIEEGIDLDHLDDTDLETFNAALARATERRNLSLATPVGEHRAMALTVHRLVTEALAEGSFEVARVVMDGIRPDPVGRLPSVAQVIGVGLGTLDEWHRDPAFARVLAHASVPEWEPSEVRAGRDILRAARNSASFDRLGALIARHGGKVALAGTLLAVAGAAIALAAYERIDVRELVGRELADH